MIWAGRIMLTRMQMLVVESILRVVASGAGAFCKLEGHVCMASSIIGLGNEPPMKVEMPCILR
jgi:hypothetical protein